MDLEHLNYRLSNYKLENKNDHRGGMLFQTNSANSHISLKLHDYTPRMQEPNKDHFSSLEKCHQKLCNRFIYITSF